MTSSVEADGGSRPEVGKLRAFLAKSEAGEAWRPFSAAHAGLAVEALAAAVQRPVALRHFAPHQLLEVSALDPAAGPPGRTLFQATVVFDPRSGAYAAPDRAWVARFHQGRPFSLQPLDPGGRREYLTELLQLAPGFWRRQVHVRAVEAATEPGAWKVTYLRWSERAGERPLFEGTVKLGPGGELLEDDLPQSVVLSGRPSPKGAEVTLEYRKPVALRNGARLVLKDIVAEEIAPGPGGHPPRGSGVTVFVVVEKGGQSETVSLVDLSEPYDSAPEASALGVTLELADSNQSFQRDVILQVRYPGGPP